ncbi:MAG: hypothetical protein AAF620_11305 [Bacteroidota bacterium]
MKKSILFFAVIVMLVTACNDSSETSAQPEISASIDWEPLPWLDQQSFIDVSIVNAAGSKIESPVEFIAGREYTLVLENEKPMAIRIDKSYGVEWLDPLPKTLKEQTRHTFRITKAADSGIENMVFQIVPMYYIEDVLTRELPQAFFIPKSDQ